MKKLARVVSVLALAAFAAPALPCSDMQTTAEAKVESPPVAKKEVPQKKATKTTTVAKANSTKPVAN
jgi:hypothetical protein